MASGDVEELVNEARPHAVFADRYRVESLLGEGGAASVYRVRDAQSGRRVALKHLRLRGTAHVALLTSQFEREYHTLSELAHPSIIEVYDYGVEGGRPYYTMELLDGEDLRERGKRPYREVCALLCDVASSLAIVHSRNRVHRDVSARNVRCTQPGRAKLLDFGAMAATGMAHPLVGTPPFVPPEAVQLQALDGRVDLYALGALCYFMLTGRHAYAAQTFSQLRDLWRSAPPTPRQYEPSVPEALDRLVMELLQLERAARPRTAAEVMERLSGIAGLGSIELPAVERAYLSVPMLVGRTAELQQVRSCLANALQGRGSSVLIEGAAGVGRSRMLDACVLEAKLLGAVVLRVNTSEVAQGESYALARHICAELTAALPILAEQSARTRRALLSHVVPLPAMGAQGEVGERPQGALPPRRLLQAALRDFFLSVARDQLVVIAVDDLASADEASAALLGLLAHGAARRRLCLLVTACSGAGVEPSAALTLLRQVARSMTLEPLQAAQTRTLVQSLFGDVEHVAALADRIHGLSEGNPRWIMMLCERLVERGLARYRTGRWTLPPEVHPDVVPSTLSAELTSRIEALSDDARELGQALALSDPGAFSLPDYAALCAHVDHSRTHRALDALVATRVLVASKEHAQFSQPEFARLLRESIAPERARALHERLAHVLTRGDRALRAQHLLLADRAEEALEACMAIPAGMADWSRTTLQRVHDTLSSVLDPHHELATSRFCRATLRLLYTGAMLGRWETFARHAPKMLERLRSDSGYDSYLAQGAPDAAAPPAIARRPGQGLTAMDNRALPADEAMQGLLGLAQVFVGTASIAQDLEVLERFPSLEPCAADVPTAAISQWEVNTQLAMLSGRASRAVELSVALVERLRRPDRAGLNAADAQLTRMSQLYLQGLVRATSGREVAPELLAELEQSSGFRAHAWRIRAVSEAMGCDFEAARESERRATLIALQDGSVLPGTAVRVELLSHLFSDNLTGVQRSMERIKGLAQRYPGWRPTHAIARCYYFRLQGDLPLALDALQPALELTRAGRHLDWPLCVHTQVLLLTELGRAAEAAACARHATDLARAADVPLPSWFRVAHAMALLRVGDMDTATQLLDTAIAEYRAIESRGLLLGAAYEARARVAIATCDVPTLHRTLAQCAHEFRLAESSAMNARYERLLREAHAAGVALPASVQFVAAGAAPQRDPIARTVHSRMLTCIGAAERASEVLRLLLEASGARGGYLFGLRGGKLNLLASVDDDQTPPDLAAALERSLREELENQENSRSVVSTSGPAQPLQPWLDSWGREFTPILLVGMHEGETVIAGVAALHHESDEHPALGKPLLHALSEALISEDLIDPITCVG